MKKVISIIVILIVIVTSGYIVYKNYDEILNYLNNKEWELTESVGSTQLNNYFAVDGTASNLIVVGNNYIKGYSNNVKEIFDESVTLMSAITDANGEYCIIGEKDGSKIYMINSSAKIWELDIQGNILDVSVNKNGYSAIIYKQTGYKSLIKVLDPDGSELFTSYLASTYAIDAEISNDNKVLAIAEIDAEGIKAQSALKFIDINNIKQENVKKITLEDELIINTEYNSKNELLVQTDLSIKVVKDVELKSCIESLDDKIILASIENLNNAVTISKLENGLFDTSYLLSIYEYKEPEIEKKEYELEKMPTLLTMKNKHIAMLCENEFIVVNTSGHLVKRCNVNGNVKSIVLFDNGSSVGLIYRDKIEFLKL